MPKFSDHHTHWPHDSHPEINRRAQTDQGEHIAKFFQNLKPNPRVNFSWEDQLETQENPPEEAGPTTPQNVRFMLRLSPAQYARLNQLAHENGTTKSRWLREAMNGQRTAEVPSINYQINDHLRYLRSNLKQIGSHKIHAQICEDLHKLARRARHQLSLVVPTQSQLKPRSKQRFSKQFGLTLPAHWKQTENLSATLRDCIDCHQQGTIRPFPKTLANRLIRHLRMINTYAFKLNAKQPVLIRQNHFSRVQEILVEYLRESL